MIYLLNWRLWAAVFVLALFPTGYLKGSHDATKHDRLEQAAAIAKANIDTFKRTEHLQRNADEASTLAATRANDDRDRAARADRNAVGLLGTLDAVERVAAASGDASAKAAAAIGADLRSCVAEYRGLGKDAAGFASDSLMYQQAWPR